MLKIGDFSRLTRISIRMLRYYDEHDILKPSVKDEESSYRYYDTGQIYLAYQINALRSMGFATSVIKEVLDKFQEKEEVVNLMKLQLCSLQEELEQVHDKIAFVHHAIQMMDKEAMNMKYEVKVRMIERKFMMCKRAIIPSYEKENLLWEGLYRELQARNLLVAMPEHGESRAYFYNEGYKEKEPDVEVCTEVKGTYTDTDHIKFKWLPAQKVASVTFQGGYEHCLEVSLVIATWIDEHNYELAGPDFCIYQIGCNEVNDPADFVTEVCFPIK